MERVAGVRALAAESRRPIILTCTDTSDIPFDTLGLQKIHLAASDPAEPLAHLEFAPPEPSIAIPYLALVALSEGYIVPASTLSKVYEQTCRSRPHPSWLCRNERDRPLPHPFSSAPPSSKDLRKTLLQLQFGCQRGWKRDDTDQAIDEGWTRWIVLDGPGAEEVKGRELGSGDPTESGFSHDELERAVIASDCLSFSDAEVARRVPTRIEDLDTGFFTTPADEEIGPPVLEPILSTSIQLPYLGRECEMVSALDEMAHQLSPNSVKFTDLDDEALEAEKFEYVNPLAVLSTQFFYHPEDETYSPLAPILPSPTLVIDYLPLFRQITLSDDAREAFVRESGATVDDLVGGGGTRGAGPRRSTRVVGGGGKVKVNRRIEWRDQGNAEWIRKSGFSL
ncbi:hypothetical protein JCM10212_004961 [Sporobolomyces blumeae]